MNWQSLTGIQVALISLVVSTLTTVILWFLSHRLGPNYERQISDLANSFRKLLEQHSSIADTLSKFTAQTEKRWRPAVKLEAEPPKNYLLLKGHKEFLIDRVVILAANDAVVSEIKNPSFGQAQSTGFRVELPQPNLVELWNNSDGPRAGWTTGTVRADIVIDNDVVSVSVPFMAKQEFHTEGSTAHAWIRLTG